MRSSARQIQELVDEHLIVTIEKGINGGYLATVGDAQSDEQRSVYEALRQAVRRLRS
jgi:hypothetical protein